MTETHHAEKKKCWKEKTVNDMIGAANLNLAGLVDFEKMILMKQELQT